MKSSVLAYCIALLFSGSLALAQDFSGKYFIQTAEGEVALTLKANDQGGYSGTLTGNGNSFQLSGIIQGGFLSGTVGEGGIIFQAGLSGEYLSMTMVEVDQFGNMLPQTTQQFVFQRRSDAPNNTDEIAAAENDGAVIINGITLTEAQISELEKNYGVRPKPGNYWYDAKCGLYGVVGYPAYGYMLPGHDFGTLARDASAGNTGVFVNKRELPQNEWAVWSYMIGYWIQPGSYWLDNKGNAGYEGSSIPVVNLYVAAQQNAYRGQGGSGDNFWSSRFSAGNYDSGNQRGYVSVPGHGPIGYGF